MAITAKEIQNWIEHNDAELEQLTEQSVKYNVAYSRLTQIHVRTDLQDIQDVLETAQDATLSAIGYIGAHKVRLSEQQERLRALKEDYIRMEDHESNKM